MSKLLRFVKALVRQSIWPSSCSFISPGSEIVPDKPRKRYCKLPCVLSGLIQACLLVGPLWSGASIRTRSTLRPLPDWPAAQSSCSPKQPFFSAPSSHSQSTSRLEKEILAAWDPLRIHDPPFKSPKDDPNSTARRKPHSIRGKRPGRTSLAHLSHRPRVRSPQEVERNIFEGETGVAPETERRASRQ